MALFKILKGASSRISTSVTPFHDGYAYFTPDDGGLYIDSMVGDAEKRIRVNPTDKKVLATLTSSGWTGKQQEVSVPGLRADQNGIIGLAHNSPTQAVVAARNGGLRVAGQTDGKITVSADGEVPKIDIPVVVVLFS